MICTHCDRGQRYCGEQCSRLARRESMREAGRRYQQTPDGRAKHAVRQAIYLILQSLRSRLSGKDDASGFPAAECPVQTVGEDAEDDLGDAQSRLEPAHEARTAMYCCVCGARCAPRRGVRALRQR